MAKTIVAYYSRTGNTRILAEAIVAKCGADLEEITDLRSRKGLVNYLRSGFEAFRERMAEISAIDKDPSDYDLTILGTPVWVGTMSSPMRTYIVTQGAKFRKIAVFATQGGSGGEKVVKQIADLCGKKPISELVVNERDIKSGFSKHRIDDFIQSLDPDGTEIDSLGGFPHGCPAH